MAVQKVTGAKEAQAEDKAVRAAQRKKKRKKRRRKAGQALGVMIFVILTLSALTLLYLVFKVETVTVSGNETMTTDEVLRLADIEPGTNIWLIDARGAINTLEKDSRIKKAEIKRVYPSLVRIVITERTPRAAIIGAGSVAVVDGECYVMDICSTDDAKGLMQVFGISSAGFQVGQRLGEKTDFNSRTLASVISAIDRHGLTDEIVSVDISNALSTYMYTASGYSVLLGQPDELDDKLEKLIIVLFELEKLGYEGGEINLSAKGDPTYSHPDANATPVPEATQTPGGTALPEQTPEGTALPDQTPEDTAAPDQTPAP